MVIGWNTSGWLLRCHHVTSLEWWWMCWGITPSSPNDCKCQLWSGVWNVLNSARRYGCCCLICFCMVLLCGFINATLYGARVGLCRGRTCPVFIWQHLYQCFSQTWNHPCARKNQDNYIQTISSTKNCRTPDFCMQLIYFSTIWVLPHVEIICKHLDRCDRCGLMLFFQT